MSNFADKFIDGYLPAHDAPFHADLKEMFCPGMKTAALSSEKKPVDLAVHCPNVEAVEFVRFHTISSTRHFIRLFFQKIIFILLTLWPFSRSFFPLVPIL